MTEAQLVASMETLRAELALSRRRELFWRLFVGMVIVSLILGFVANRRQSNAIEDARDEARVGACLQDNIRIKQHNRLVAGGAALQTEINAILEFSTTLPPGAVLTPEQQERRDAYLTLIAEQRSLVENALRVTSVETRDCSQAGISKYLQVAGSS